MPDTHLPTPVLSFFPGSGYRRYAIVGPPGTPYEGGVYHGKLKFPSDFPFKPPSIYMITPNGASAVPAPPPTCPVQAADVCLLRLERPFRPLQAGHATLPVHERLSPCVRPAPSKMRTQSDLTGGARCAGDGIAAGTWQPSWTVASILTGLLSFMLESTATTGSIETSDATKRKLAAASHAFNLQDRVFLGEERIQAGRMKAGGNKREERGSYKREERCGNKRET